MAGQFTPYSPLKNTLDLDGYTVQGFPEDEYITIEADADSMTATPGTDATVCLVENHNPLATMKLKLLQNSQANSVLADFERNKTVFSVMLQESNAPDGEQVRAQAEAAFVKKQAPIKRGSQHIATEWEIQLIRPKLFNGGLDDGTV